jgi:RNA polymerase sigma-32 factor
MNGRTPVRKHYDTEKLFDDPANYQEGDYEKDTAPLLRTSPDDKRPWWKRGGAFLDRNEEFRLARKWLKQGDRKARERILNAHLPLVHKCARELLPLPEEDALFKDAMSAGCVGMAQALTRFNPDLGYRFSTCATKWIRSEIKRVRRHAYSHIKTPRGCPFIGVDSLNDTTRDYEGDKVQKLDLLVDEETIGPEERLIQEERADRDSAALELALKRLDQRERYVFSARHLSDDPSTLEQLAAALGVSSERVRQLEVRASIKVKTFILNSASQVEARRLELPKRHGVHDGLDPERRYRMLIDRGYSPAIAEACIRSPHREEIFAAFEADNRRFAKYLPNRRFETLKLVDELAREAAE